MNRPFGFLLIAVLSACGKLEPIETEESLTATPEHLKELRQQCKTDRARLGDKLCNRVAEATNRRFMGDGKVPYTSSKDAPKF